MLLFLIIAAVSMFTIAGCSSQSSSADGKVTLKFFHRWPKEPEKSYFEEVVKEFEKDHPDIDIQIEAVLNDSYKDKIKVMLGTTSPPDIYFSWSDEFAFKFIRGNKALDLSSYYKNDTDWSSQLVQSQITPFTYENKQYGVPWQMDAKSFFYNKDIFQKLNLDPPKTWDELIDVSKKLKEHGYTPISFGTKATWTISHYIGTLNQRMVDEKTREKDYNAKLENDLPQLCGLVPVSFDFSTNREDDYLRRVCPYVTYAFFSGSDLSESECGELAKTAHGYGAKMVCMTRGGQGAILSAGDRVYHQPIVEADIIDTLGAGDSFIAGFLTAFCVKQDITYALRQAAETAAKTCGVYGAFGYGYPYRLEDGGSSEKTRIL
ncbi:extracellular solute-binding protein [Bacillus subtilis subsp. subtilis]|nr:extracellular solute-binding protein [Bacillus subtilis subsp. subtilis]